MLPDSGPVSSFITSEAYKSKYRAIQRPITRSSWSPPKILLSLDSIAHRAKTKKRLSKRSLLAIELGASSHFNDFDFYNLVQRSGGERETLHSLDLGTHR